jgi:hypothetical protein
VPRPQPEPPTYFIDRCLGRVDVPQALRQVGAVVELHDDHFKQDQDDADWLSIVGARGWIVLTKDKAIRRREIEIQALLNAGVGAFILTAGGMTGPTMAAAFVAALRTMARHSQTMARPFVATVSTSGSVTILRGGQRRGGIKRES